MLVVPVVYCAISSDNTVANAAVYGLEQANKNGLFQFASRITYDCLDGRKFDDGYVSKVMTCGYDVRWEPTLSNCDCK